MNGPRPRDERYDDVPADEASADSADPARMDRVALPRLNPWLALLILVLLGFGYLGLWGWLLGGGP